MRGMARFLWDNRSGPESACNTIRGLTRLSGTSREGLPDMVPNFTPNTTTAACKSCGNPTPEYSGMGQYPKYCTVECRDATYRAAKRAKRTRPTAEERFRAKTVTNTTGCIEWTASKNEHGYGQFRVSGKSVLAHRFAYEMRHGAIGSAQVLHRCDNPACCNVDHLFLGSHDDNMRDRDAKGRTLYGTQGRHRYGNEVICSIREMLHEGMSHRQINAQTGVSMTHISYIRQGKTRAKG